MINTAGENNVTADVIGELESFFERAPSLLAKLNEEEQRLEARLAKIRRFKAMLTQDSPHSAGGASAPGDDEAAFVPPPTDADFHEQVSDASTPEAMLLLLGRVKGGLTFRDLFTWMLTFKPELGEGTLRSAIARARERLDITTNETGFQVYAAKN